jgi:hypothetical protein
LRYCWLFLIGFVFILSLNMITQHGVARTVPLVVGKNSKKFKPIWKPTILKWWCRIRCITIRWQPAVIIRQVPEADAVVKVNRTIYVTINRVVPPDVDMPNLVGYSFP